MAMNYSSKAQVFFSIEPAIVKILFEISALQTNLALTGLSKLSARPQNYVHLLPTLILWLWRASPLDCQAHQGCVLDHIFPEKVSYFGFDCQLSDSNLGWQERALPLC